MSLHHITAGLTTFPKKRMWSFFWSVMKIMNGWSKRNIIGNEANLISTVVTAAAVVPSSSTSRVALCKT